MDKSQPAISVVIPSYNQETTIERCIQSVLHQATNLKYEVIVVDSSNNDTKEILKKYSEQIKLIRSRKRLYAGKARNIGIKVAKANIIAFADSDCVVNNDWINQIYYAHKKYDVVGGRIINGNPQNLLGWSLYLMEFSPFAGCKNKVMSMMPTCNISYKKQIFKKCGYFPEDIFPGEDLVLNSKINMPLVFLGSIVVRHINRTTLPIILKHSFHLGCGAAFAIKRAKIDCLSLLRKKYLIPLHFIRNILGIAWHSLRSNHLMIFCITSPLILMNLISWYLGFLRNSTPSMAHDYSYMYNRTS